MAIEHDCSADCSDCWRLAGILLGTGMRPGWERLRPPAPREDRARWAMPLPRITTQYYTIYIEIHIEIYIEIYIY